MERRRFLATLIGGLAGIAVEQAIPFGRVWSFPKNIVVPLVQTAGIDLAVDGDEWNVITETGPDYVVGNRFAPAVVWYDREALENLFREPKPFRVGQMIKVRMPQSWYVRDLLTQGAHQRRRPSPS